MLFLAWRRVLVASALLPACGPAVPAGGESTGGPSEGDGTVIGPMGPTSTVSSDGTTGEPETGNPNSSFDDGIETTCAGLPDGVEVHCTPPDPTTGCGFLDCEPPCETANCDEECSLAGQDCMKGEACKPWANDGGVAWNAAKCSPVAGEPSDVGDPCTVEGSGLTGVDSCIAGGMCWNVDARANAGECVALCGDGAAPCVDGSSCVIANGGLLPVCLPACDPLVPECDAGQGCYPDSDDGFVCVREGDAVTVGGLEHPACPAGSLAVDQDTCAAYCDLAAKAPCDEGLVCTPYFADAPKGLEAVGVCT